MSEILEKMEEAKAFAQHNIYECSKELIELDETGILKDGKVRELARMLSFTGHNSLSVAKSIINQAALILVEMQELGQDAIK